MINIEAIDAEAINTVDPGGSMIIIEVINDQCRGNQCRGDQHLILGGLMIVIEAIDTEVINTVDPGRINDCHRGNQ